MGQDQLAYSRNFDPRQSSVIIQPNWIEPEPGDLVIMLHMHMGRPVVEQEQAI